MRIVRENHRKNDPKVSLVLLDWGCRESFHTLEYLNHLVTPRDNYEVIWVEYYDRQPSEIVSTIERYESHGLPSPIDTWIIMDKPKGEVFRKHVMNNLGLLHSRGEIVAFMDSDAITSTTFVETLLLEFNDDPDVILYIEEIRTGDKRFYPFAYPNYKEIIPFASNLANGVPLGMRNFRCGLLEDPSLIHWRNYGACFAARCDDLLKVGGWDEHDDYTGYIAGPYEMSMRLEWAGKRERWSFRELLWHVPHPGNDGIDNFSGPHDGKGVSTTAMRILETRRTLPLCENPEIRRLRVQKFGNSPPPAIEQRPARRHVNEHTPSSPVPSGLAYVPSHSQAIWNNDLYMMVGKILQDVETRLLKLTYPRAFTVGAYAAAIANQLNLPQERIEATYIAGMMQSLDMLLNPPNANQVHEAESFIHHTLADLWQVEPLVTVSKVASTRHQRYDGDGCSLQGKRIPLESRIVALAIMFDDLVNLRGTGGRMEFSQAWKTIERESSRRFDPQVVDAARACLEDLVCIHLRSCHGLLPFMYPCYRYKPAQSPQPSMNAETLGEFQLLTQQDVAGTRYTLIPTWSDSTGFFTSTSKEEILHYSCPKMAVSDYHGHNILLYGGRYFAVPHGLNEFSLGAYYRGDYGRRVTSSGTLETIKGKVLRLAFRHKTRSIMLRPAKFIVRRVLK